MDTIITSTVISALIYHFQFYAPTYGRVIPTYIMTKAITKWVSTLGEDYKLRNSLLKITGNLMVLNTILDIPINIQANGFFGEKVIYNEIFEAIKDKFF